MTDDNHDLVDFGYIRRCLTTTACTILGLGLLATWATSDAAKAEHPKAAAQRALSATPDVVDAAFSACKAIGRKRVIISCEVEADVSAIDVTLHIEPFSAPAYCKDTASAVTRSTRLFAGQGWMLRIFNPAFTGTRLRARCPLN
jgi:hypothetical protein